MATKVRLFDAKDMQLARASTDSVVVHGPKPDVAVECYTQHASILKVGR